MNMKNIIIIIVLLGVAFFAFNYLSGSSAASTGSLSADTSSSNSNDAQYIYTLLQKMQQVKLDDSIFSNSVFQGLKDNTVIFAPQAAGRNNPFSPIGSDLLGANPSTTTSAKAPIAPTH